VGALAELRTTMPSRWYQINGASRASPVFWSLLFERAMHYAASALS
jgi:hypothetical protein